MKYNEKKNFLRTLQTGGISAVKELMDTLPAEDIAVLLNTPAKIEIKKMFELMSRKKTLLTFKHLRRDVQYKVLKVLSLKQSIDILNNISPDDRTSLFQYIPKTDVAKWLNLLSHKEREVTDSLLAFPEESVGRIMTPSFVTVRPDWNVSQALSHIRDTGQDTETLASVYVTDDKGFLVDDIKIRTLLLSPLSKRVSQLMEEGRMVTLNTNDDQQEAVNIFKTTRRYVLPVIDERGILRGVVTVDDLVHLMDEKSTRDIHKIGGSEFFTENYFNIPLFKMLKKRAGWLVLLFLSEMLTATAMGFFEKEIARAVVLALFVPLVISSGGNSGSQSSTIIIRSMALGDIHFSDWFRVFKRELSTGAFLGIILGAIGFLRISVWSVFTNIYGPHWLMLAFTIGIALTAIVLWGTLVGSMLPIALRKIGFDPAASSAPFVATLVDVTGLLIYFTTAYLVLRGVLL